MKQYYFFTLAAILLINSSCNKKDSKPPEGDYTPSTVIASDIKMYTVNGEVKDAALIRKHIAGLGIGSYFTFQSQEAANIGITTLRLNKENASIIYTNGNTNTLTYKKQEPQKYLLNWVAGQPFSVSGTIIQNNCTKIAEKVLLYPVQKLNYSEVPSTSGVNIVYTPSVDYVLNNQGGQLSAPLISYSIANINPGTQTSSCYSASGNVWNEFDAGVLSSLKANDTLVVQTKTVILKKK